MPKRPEHFRQKMKHLNGKQKNRTKQKKRKTCQKPVLSNSGKGYNITYKNLRSRCAVESEASLIKCEMRRNQMNNMQFTPKKKTPTSFPPGFSNSGKGYKVIYKNLRSRCIVENEASIIKRKLRRYQVENEASLFRPKMSCHVANLQYPDFRSTLSIFPPVYKSTERYAGLNTFKNKAVTFFFENGEYEIFVEDLIGNQERGSLSVDFFSCKNSNEGDSPSLVVLKPRPSNIDLQVHANDQNLELHESENQNSPQENKFFILHKIISGFVSFECCWSQGLYIGVKENRLELMEKKEDDEAVMFRLTK